jgi:hypothetical protein
MKKIITLVAAACAVAFLVPTAASAAPKGDPDETITVDCPGTSFDGQVVTASNSMWTPAFQGRGVFLPVAFGPFSGTFTSDEGTFSFTDPPVVQNANKGGANARMECSYTIVGVSDEGTFSGSGTVVVVIVGRR